MKRKHVVLCAALLLAAFVPSLALADSRLEQIAEEITGEKAYEHVEYLSEVIGIRQASTAKEREAQEYIAKEFEEMGYAVEIQPFIYERNNKQYASANVIATKPGKNGKTVLIGAHYDSVRERSCPDGNVATGAGDNASGVAVMLEVAEVLSEYRTPATIKFIAFGAEEVGLKGSKYYAGQMTAEEVTNTVAMVNLDMVGVGDFFYVYAGLDNNPGTARDLALKIGKKLEYDLRTTGPDALYGYGVTGDWSDHVFFRLKGIPIAYFEWWNWDIGGAYGLETLEYGDIYHTCRDNIYHVNIEKMEMTADVVGGLLYKLSKSKQPKMERTMMRRSVERVQIQQRNGQPFNQ